MYDDPQLVEVRDRALSTRKLLLHNPAKLLHSPARLHRLEHMFDSQDSSRDPPLPGHVVDRLLREGLEWELAA